MFLLFRFQSFVGVASCNVTPPSSPESSFNVTDDAAVGCTGIYSPQQQHGGGPRRRRKEGGADRFLLSFKITNPITDSENMAMILLLLMMMKSAQPSSDGQWSSCEVDGAALIFVR